MFQEQAEQELFETVKAFHACKQADGQSVSTYIEGYDQESFSYPSYKERSYPETQTISSRQGKEQGQDCGTHICNTIQGLRGIQKLNKSALDLYVSNGKRAAVKAIGSFDLILPSEMQQEIQAQLGFYFLWHCRLGHIIKKRIAKLQHDGLIKSIDDESFDVCVSCISGEMARKAFTHAGERANDLLGFIHSDVCDPFRTTSREGANYYVTFTDDFNRRKWLFKKKTDMDGNIHTYKDRLIAKGFTQTYGVDSEENYSPITKIKAIRILIAISAFYDYESWQIDVKTAFLNGRLNKDIYMVQPEGFVNPKHPRRVCKLQRSIYRLKQASRSWNKRFVEEIKISLPMQPNVDLSKTQGPSTPAEVKRMKGVPYALAVESRRKSLTAVKNILKYLQNNKDMFLVYGGDSTTELSVTCYTDAGWETDWDDLRSQTGLGIVPSNDRPMDMYYDNTDAITIAGEPEVQKGAKNF
ncbi:retrotransposon protein, putative, ty1-copia subclass [Tanacetum coccineum]